MTWLVWRQHRSQVYFAIGALAAFAALLLVTGLQMASQYHAAQAACAASDGCGNLANSLFLGNHAIGFLVIMTVGVPALLGLFWGAPLVARELETGTSQFAWMQSVTRRRWLTVKTGWLLLAAAAWGGAVSGLVTWWSGPNNALQLDAFKPGRFDIQGIVPVGYALFAVALGVASGAILRRTLPALAVTLGVFLAARLLIAEFARQHYMTAITVIYNLGRPVTPTGSAWQIAQGSLGPQGVIAQTDGVDIDGVPLAAVPPGCRPGPSATAGEPHNVMSCLTAHGIRGFVTYQPASRYWAFQGIETGIFVLLAAVLLTVTAAVLLRRDV